MSYKAHIQTKYFPITLKKGAQNNVIIGPKSSMEVDLPHICKEVHVYIYWHIHSCIGLHTHTPFSTEKNQLLEIIAT